MKLPLLLVPFCASLAFGAASVEERVFNREFPSIFQAWNPIDMPQYPLDTEQQRLVTAAKHDLLWEEPVSQLGYGVKLVLGAVWDHENGGIATQFTEETREQALKNRTTMHEINPDMIFLMEIRWKDAPSSYLPEDSDWWKRDENGERIPGWLGGPEPYYYLNYHHEGFREQVKLQARVAVESGVYDGIMLDWWGSHGESDPLAMSFLKGIREGIGEDGIIVVNNDRMAPLPNTAPYVNGAFQENTFRFHNTPEKWQDTIHDLIWFETHFREPRTNCYQIQTGDIYSMRCGLAAALIFSDGYYLFSRDDNNNPAPDHLHHWFKEYDVKLGKPVDTFKKHENGLYSRDYDHGTVVLNLMGNGEQTMTFEKEMTRYDGREEGKTFVIPDRDGQIYLRR